MGIANYWDVLQGQRVMSPDGPGVVVGLIPFDEELARDRIMIAFIDGRQGKYYRRSELIFHEELSDEEEAIAMRERAKIVRSWARERLQNDACILDTETTGFGPKAGIIDIALVTAHGQVLLDTLVYCDSPMQPGAYRTHHISSHRLAGKPTIKTIWGHFAELFSSREIVIYNAAFDLGMLEQSLAHYDIKMPTIQAYCLMQQYSAYIHEFVPSGVGYRQQKLSHACQRFGIPEGKHRALSDAKATQQVLLCLTGLKG